MLSLVYMSGRLWELCGLNGRSLLVNENSHGHWFVLFAIIYVLELTQE